MRRARNPPIISKSLIISGNRYDVQPGQTDHKQQKDLNSAAVACMHQVSSAVHHKRIPSQLSCCQSLGVLEINRRTTGRQKPSEDLAFRCNARYFLRTLGFGACLASSTATRFASAGPREERAELVFRSAKAGTVGGGKAAPGSKSGSNSGLRLVSGAKRSMTFVM